MKKLLLLAVLALALPMAVFADSGVDYTNSGGTLAGSNSGLTLSGSTLIAVKGFNGGGLITGNDLGSLPSQPEHSSAAIFRWVERSLVAGRSPSLGTAPTEFRTARCSQELSMVPCLGR